jgi:hypothetical protein
VRAQGAGAFYRGREGRRGRSTEPRPHANNGGRTPACAGVKGQEATASIGGARRERRSGDLSDGVGRGRPDCAAMAEEIG